jgi:solute:Na+ symporter, SSS family
MTLSVFDQVIVVLYLAVIMGIGFAMKRRASRGMTDYFLGGRQLPWWALAMSGSSSYFDITGTMWIVSMFILMGLKGMWIHWLWGFPITAFYLAYMGKWIRRSNVLTGAEWMYTRFGRNRAGDVARLSYTLFAILTIAALLGYGAIGMGKFGAIFLGMGEFQSAALILAITGLYVVAGGFHGIVRVEIIQTIVLSAGAITLAVLGYRSFDPAVFDSRVSAGWGGIAPQWKPSELTGTEFELYGAFLAVWVAKGLLLCLSGPEQLYDFQRFLAARDARDASKLGALWGLIHTVRWPFAMAIAVMALGDPSLAGLLKTDSEKALPVIITKSLPIGLVGFMLAALLSGFLATFSSTVNGGAAYLVKDVFQRYVNPDASPKTLLYVSYFASAFLIAAGLAISFFGKSISGAFTWIFGTLAAGILPPNVLRWYWWRLNGQGYAAGVFVGMALSLGQVVFEYLSGQSVPLYVGFPVIALISTVVCVVVAMASEPTDNDTLVHFYRNVQPAGAWGKVKAEVLRREPGFTVETPFRIDALNTILALIGITCLYVSTLYLVLHRHGTAAALFAITAAMAAILYFTWYKRLPPPGDGVGAEINEAFVPK